MPHAHGLIDRSEFNLPNALFLARMAELVYRDADPVLTQLVEAGGFDEAEFFDDDGTQCFVAADDRFAVVSFRGTEPDELEDWIADARASLVTGPLDGQVHAGFYDALSKVWRLVDDFVRYLMAEQPRRLFVTGHSLGAALATLAVARWYEAECPVRGLYTFGQPRTGDDQFARNFNFALRPRAFRFVNNSDLVTRVPPRAFGYSHLGSFKYFSSEGKLHEDISWWNQFLDRWRGRWQDVFEGGDSAIEDHSMQIYRERIAVVFEATQQWQTILDDSFDRFLRLTQADHFQQQSRRAA